MWNGKKGTWLIALTLVATVASGAAYADPSEPEGGTGPGTGKVTPPPHNNNNGSGSGSGRPNSSHPTPPASGGGTGHTPPPATGKVTPPPATGKVTPPATGKVTPPPATGKVTPPPATGKVTPPPATGKVTPPPATGKVTPPPATGKVTPPPATGKVTPPPASGNGSGHASGGGSGHFTQPPVKPNSNIGNGNVGNGEKPINLAQPVKHEVVKHIATPSLPAERQTLLEQKHKGTLRQEIRPVVPTSNPNDKNHNWADAGHQQRMTDTHTHLLDMRNKWENRDPELMRYGHHDDHTGMLDRRDDFHRNHWNFDQGYHHHYFDYDGDHYRWGYWHDHWYRWNRWHFWGGFFWPIVIIDASEDFWCPNIYWMYADRWDHDWYGYYWADHYRYWAYDELPFSWPGRLLMTSEFNEMSRSISGLSTEFGWTLQANYRSALQSLFDQLASESGNLTNQSPYLNQRSVIINQYQILLENENARDYAGNAIFVSGVVVNSPLGGDQYNYPFEALLDLDHPRDPAHFYNGANNTTVFYPNAALWNGDYYPVELQNFNNLVQSYGGNLP